MHTNNSNSHNRPWFNPPLTNQQHPIPSTPFEDPLIMQQQLSGSQPANTMPQCEGSTQYSYGPPLCVSHVYQGVAQQHQQQYRAPSSGRSHNQRSKGSRETEAQYTYHISHESSGMMAGDHSTGIYPGYAQTIASDNTGVGGAWRPPSRNPSMVDRNSPQQMRIARYNRERVPWTRKSRTDKVDVSVFEIPITESERGAMTGGSNIPGPAPMLSTWAPGPSPSSVSVYAPATLPPTSTMSTSRAYGEDNPNTNAQERPAEEDDFDTVSLGSE